MGRALFWTAMNHTGHEASTLYVFQRDHTGREETYDSAHRNIVTQAQLEIRRLSTSVVHSQRTSNRRGHSVSGNQLHTLREFDVGGVMRVFRYDGNGKEIDDGPIMQREEVIQAQNRSEVQRYFNVAAQRLREALEADDFARRREQIAQDARVTASNMRERAEEARKEAKREKTAEAEETALRLEEKAKELESKAEAEKEKAKKAKEEKEEKEEKAKKAAQKALDEQKEQKEREKKKSEKGENSVRPDNIRPDHTDGAEESHTRERNQAQPDNIRPDHTDGAEESHTRERNQAQPDNIRPDHTDGVEKRRTRERNQAQPDNIRPDHTDGVEPSNEEGENTTLGQTQGAEDYVAVLQRGIGNQIDQMNLQREVLNRALVHLSSGSLLRQ